MAVAFVVAAVSPKTDRRIQGIGAHVGTKTYPRDAREGQGKASGRREAPDKILYTSLY